MSYQEIETRLMPAYKKYLSSITPSTIDQNNIDYAEYLRLRKEISDSYPDASLFRNDFRKALIDNGFIPLI